MKYDIFVSYRRTDRELVARIVQKLEAAGVGVWYDAEIAGGADWRETIVEALTNSDMLVIFFSEECNQSRQLKKELAVADDLNKPVVPILIEDTKPKGAYLYELADRNWIQAFPNPAEKVDEIVRHLAELAEKSPGGLDSVKPAAPPPAPAADAEIAPEAAAAPQLEAQTVAASSSSAPSAARASVTDYLRKTEAKAAKGQLNDVLPFRWVDLLFLVPLVAVVGWQFDQDLGTGSDALFSRVLAHVVVAIAVIGLYGALVFPFRYYLRGRRTGAALFAYLLSSLILYIAAMGSFTTGWLMGLFPNDNPTEFGLLFATIWAVFTAIAFFIYAVLAAQRAVRAFRRNLKKI